MDIKLIAVGARPWELWFGYWGVSYLVNGTILYDAFSNYHVLGRKLRKAKVDLSAIQAVVLSHDHWDHTGGLWGLLKEHPGIDVYLPPTAKEAVKRRVTSEGGKLVDMPGIKTLNEDVLLSDEMTGTFNDKSISEQFLLVKAEKGFVVLVGCSHPGIVSIVQKAKETFGVSIYGVVGGLHLMHSSTEEIYACANALKNEGIRMVSPTHCTGMRAERIFRNVFGKGFVCSREGQTLSL
ncbi:MAG: MBL fold metallo-hydrolase [Alphaproteobacteria bacterium]|nr:MBL fold metallo-hydrolase [Alphaproteobacteria bacterium]